MLLDFLNVALGLIRRLWSWFSFELSTLLWGIVTMRLGFKFNDLKFALLAAALVSDTQAQCPDYTTYSQVRPL